MILAVPLSSHLGYSTLATVGGMLFIIVALFPLLDKNVRKMETEDIQAHNKKEGTF